MFRSFKVALLYIRVTTHPEALYLRMYPAMPIGQLHEPTTRRRWCPSKRLGLMESRWDRFQGVTAKRTEGSTHRASAVMVDTAEFGTGSAITSISQAQIASARVNSKSHLLQL